MSSGTKAPAYQWYPGDHRRDVALQACTFEARALWREMLDLMHDGEPRGYLTAGGVPIDDATLARMVGAPLAKVRRWREELEQRGVFSRTDAGVIYSRRMVKDEHIRQVRAAAGKQGGNPALLDKQKSKQSPNHPPNQTGEQNPTPAVAVAVATAALDRSRSVGSQGEAPRVPVREPAAEADRPTELGASAGTATAPGDSGPPHRVLEHPDVVAWRERFYCVATMARLADVDAQLLAAVSAAGAPTDDGRTAQCTPEVLAGLCAEMAGAKREPTDPELAVVWLLRNIASGKRPKTATRQAVATVRAEQRQAAATAHRATLPDPVARAASELLADRRMLGRFAEDFPEEHARLYAQAKQHAPQLKDTAAVAAAIEGTLIPLVRRRRDEMRQQSPLPADSESATPSLALAGAAT